MSRKLSWTHRWWWGRQGAGHSVFGLTLLTCDQCCWDVRTRGKDTKKKQSHDVSDEHIRRSSEKKKVREHAVVQNKHRARAITASFTLWSCALRLTMGGGLVPPANPCIAAPVIVRPWGSVSLQQGEVLTAVLVQVVANCL